MKITFVRLIILTAASLLFVACARQSQLPKEIPTNFEIKYEQNYPGASKSLVKWAIISTNQLKYERVRCSGTLTKNIPDSKVKEIYKTLVKEEFDLIENKETEDHKEFQQISLRAGNISKSIKYGDKSPFSKKDSESLGAIRTDISELIEDEVEDCQN